MGNRATLQPNVFSSENQPVNRGRKKGSRNRSTLFKKWLKVKLDVEHPGADEKQRGTLEDAIVLALLKKAKEGDVAAFREVMDSVYGKLTENQNLNLNLKELSDEELEALINS